MKGEAINYIPHRGHMKLLDTIESTSDDYCWSQTLINDRMPTVSSGKVPGYFLVELMAQTIAAYNTLYYSENQKVELGFLVGIRNFKGPKEYINVGDIVECQVFPTLIMGSAGTFKCQAKVGDDIFESTLTAYVPTDNELEKFKTK